MGWEVGSWGWRWNPLGCENTLAPQECPPLALEVGVGAQNVEWT